jgi:predicted dehydrogenase
MQAGIIGYGSQSKKIVNILLKKNLSKIIIYKKSSHEIIRNKKIKTTNILKDLDKINIIFICSPSTTHSDYIKYFINKAKYIFCEKPGLINLKEWNYLNKLSNNNKKKIYFNFNYHFSKYFQNIEKELQNNQNGKLINLSFYASHGLAFKNKQDIKERNIFENIHGNLGVHYINFFLKSLKDIEILKSHRLSIAKKKKDTSFIYFKSKKIFGNLFLSYASVAYKFAIIHFSNCIIMFDNDKIRKFYPRDIYSKNGLFVTPKQKITLKGNKNHITKSLELSIEFFLGNIKKNNFFRLKNYYLGINSAKILIRSFEKYK